jgi:hypothetical protein
MARVLTAAVPLQAAELDLPISWQRLATWGAVTPSDDCIAEVTSTLLDAALEREDVGFGQRLLMAPLLPWVRSAMRSKFRELAQRQLFEASCTPAILGRQIAAPARERVAAALGLSPQSRLAEFKAP